jgi:hypothetical protein
MVIVGLGLSLSIKMQLSYRENRVLPPPQGMEFVHFGFNDSIADVLWLSFIQQAWNCQQTQLCHKNWGFRVLDETTILSPKFKSPYVYGGTMLSVLIDDDFGAKVIFDRGLENFPKDWVLNYRAGYHYLIEIEDQKRAADLFTAAADNGAPFWTKSLAARLYERSGELEVSEFVLRSMIESTPEAYLQDSLKERLLELQKKRSQK